MDKGLIIFQENGLFGAKSQTGEIIIEPQYIEMRPFSCGLSQVRNSKYHYAYVNAENKQIVPFGKYAWCDPQFTCGFSRVMGNKWGIIDTLGNIVVPLEYDKIWTLKEEYLFSCKAFMGNKEEKLNLHQLASKVILDGLTYIHIYSVEEFKLLTHCERLCVKLLPNGKQLFFTYGSNFGFVSAKGIPQNPVIAIVANSSGKIFPLLIERSDIGKTTLPLYLDTSKESYSKKCSQKTPFGDYDGEKMNNADNWRPSYEDEQYYYDGWSREDIESGLADAYEGDLDARWNTD